MDANLHFKGCSSALSLHTRAKRVNLAKSLFRRQARAGCCQARGIKSLLARASSFFYSLGLRRLELRRHQHSASTVAPVVYSGIMTGSSSYQTSKHTYKQKKTEAHFNKIDLRVGSSRLESNLVTEVSRLSGPFSSVKGWKTEPFTREAEEARASSNSWQLFVLQDALSFFVSIVCFFLRKSNKGLDRLKADWSLGGSALGSGNSSFGKHRTRTTTSTNSSRKAFLKSIALLKGWLRHRSGVVLVVLEGRGFSLTARRPCSAEAKGCEWKPRMPVKDSN
eukprot:5559698-Amphidinium_carterae.2